MRPLAYAKGGAGGLDQPGTPDRKASAFFLLQGQTMGSEQLFPVSGLFFEQTWGSEQVFPVSGLFFGQTWASEQVFPVSGLFLVFFLAAASKGATEARISR
jgi:hypothetical protein